MKRVTITCGTPGAEIRYTLDNSEPTQSSNLYSGPFTVEDPTAGGTDITIKAKGFKADYQSSGVVSYVIEAPEMQKLATPTLSLSRSGATVTGTVGNTVSGASYRYKVSSEPASETDGTAISGTTFSFSNASAVTVYVKGFMTGYLPSDSALASVSAQPTCATPSISQSGNTVTFTCSTSGATIHYSGCGKSGTCSSGGSVSITQSGTMTAYATRSGYKQSGTASRSCTYTAPKCATPTVSQSRSTVTMSCSTPNATIYWKEAGETGYTQYTGPFTISGVMIIQYYATAPGYTRSDEGSTTLSYTPTFPSFTVYYDSDAVYNGVTMPKWYVVCSNKPSGAKFVIHDSTGSSTMSLTDSNGNPCVYSRLTTPSTFESVVGSASGYSDRTVSTYTRV